jgi:cobalt transport protein ATP-binding subunit
LALVETRDLWFKYPLTDAWTLRGISLSIDKGEFVAIVGPSGAGKTTLCLCLNGLIPNNVRGQFKGRVAVAGLNTATTSVAEIAHHVGMVFQSPESQLFGLTVEEEIAFGPENYKLPVGEIAERIDWALDIVRMKDLVSKSPYDLSGGQKQRVAIAGALALRPEVLIMDEPLTELDPIGKREVSTTIKRLRDEHEITVILVEHETEEIADYADRVVLVDEGQVNSEGTPRDFFQRVKYLQARGIDPPQVTRLASRLRDCCIWDGSLPIKLDEATSSLKEILANHSSSAAPTPPSDVRSENEPIISLDNVSFAYPDGTKALKNIKLEIKRGEFTAIIGQNGSGKTTLAKHLNGLLKPTTGTVRVLGKDTRKLTVADLARTVGHLFQNPDHQIFSKTVEEEVAFGPLNLRYSREEVASRVSEALSTIGIQELKDEHPLFLSKGQRQLVALASIISMNPEVLILDEPTTGQDATGRKRIMDLMHLLNAAGKTIIVITHDMRLVAEYSPRTVVMWQGEIIADEATRKIFSKPELLAQTFIQPPQITRLSYKFRQLGVALSVNEMSDRVLQLLKT